MGRSKPLARKMMNLVGGILAVSMLLSTAAFTIFEYFAIRRSMVASLASQASVIGVAAGPSLVFENPQDTATVLGTLKNSRNIEKAAVYLVNGDWFAGYPTTLPKEAFTAVARKEPVSVRFEQGSLNYVSEITQDGTRVGWLYIQSGLGEITERAVYALKVQIGILLAVFLLVFLMVSRLQRSITNPIHHLAETAQAISAGESYGFRVVVEQGGEEIEMLGESFNNMISAVEERDRRLLAHQGNLEAEVAARTTELTQMNAVLVQAKERAEDASKAKSAFLASMSHELRTPLNAVLGFAQIMDRNPDRNAQDHAHLEKIMKAGEHLLDLINDVLSVARIEARTLTLNTQLFDSRNFFDLIQAMIRVRSEAKGLSFDVEIDPRLPDFLEADEGKLRQVLLNLLGNAVKFTHEGGIGLRVFYPNDNHLHFSIVDTGPGISPEEVDNLFGRFVQTETGRRNAEGSGLGLYLSQALVGLMGGEIKAESRLGYGSTFSFAIPVQTSSVAPVAEAKRGRLVLEPGQPVLRHLVVDDKANNRELLMEFLQSTGFEVRSAENGMEAIRIWEEWRPTVVWMDMRMPVMDGFEAARHMRELEMDKELPRTIILAITASVFEHDREAVLEAGCDGMLGKPFRVLELFEILETKAGVRFQEQAGESLEPARALGGEDLDGLDPEWKAELLEALARGDTERAMEHLKALPETSQRLAEYLGTCLQEFRIDEVERFFKETP